MTDRAQPLPERSPRIGLRLRENLKNVETNLFDELFLFSGPIDIIFAFAIFVKKVMVRLINSFNICNRIQTFKISVRVTKSTKSTISM